MKLYFEPQGAAEVQSIIVDGRRWKVGNWFSNFIAAFIIYSKHLLLSVAKKCTEKKL